ncbi:MAG: DNA mismatch repair endonuclease MutL [Saprospirales bacterium]|nr:MAG: DNA mismatch repair endonuclease MutL [Saprospirales bacterium]
MSNIIKLLPDHIANQIAAGEVIQRPASVVKELMENSIDSGANHIQLILKDSGKQLIQVVDNGKGMNPEDARLAFERHATSKISSGEDLFNIRTMGFRGEALASIAAVARVELITRQEGEELGTRILIEGSEVSSQEPAAALSGTSISVKNLFYNIPARRKFLKSDRVELRHIIQEFERIALGFPQIEFSLHNDDSELMKLPGGNLKERILNVFGKNLGDKLFPISETTDFLTLKGFAVKPQFCKKSRKEQFLFLNNRYFKSGYLHHAVKGAYEGLLTADEQPSYFIFFDIDPTLVDVNVHPTKQEVKFQDERIIYNLLRVTIRHGLGKHQLTPTLDFDLERGERLIASGHISDHAPNAASTSGKASPSPSGGSFQPSAPRREKEDGDNWAQIFEGIRKDLTEQPGADQMKLETGEKKEVFSGFFQVLQRYVVIKTDRGVVLINQQRAHEQILYEQFLKSIENEEGTSQNLLFPKTIEMAASEAALLQELVPDLQKTGLQIEHFGGNSFVIHGRPAIWTREMEEEEMLTEILENYRIKGEYRDLAKRIAFSMARSLRIPGKKVLSETEMSVLISKMLVEKPHLDLIHKKTVVTLDEEALSKLFKS